MNRLPVSFCASKLSIRHKYFILGLPIAQLCAFPPSPNLSLTHNSIKTPRELLGSSWGAQSAAWRPNLWASFWAHPFSLRLPLQSSLPVPVSTESQVLLSVCSAGAAGGSSSVSEQGCCRSSWHIQEAAMPGRNECVRTTQGSKYSPGLGKMNRLCYVCYAPCPRFELTRGFFRSSTVLMEYVCLAPWPSKTPEVLWTALQLRPLKRHFLKRRGDKPLHLL